MIERFEVGKKYRWIGPSVVDHPNFSPTMGIVLDGNPQKCVVGSGSRALFEGMFPEPYDTYLPYFWSQFMHLFEEVTE